ncbi:hypothetical protein H2200_005138 [Cladophialophora chaetospira]|uniref:Uncharacterized protein n=1 Tax=Cladophialophora chaetospira TaxID=386627 RepID=A0AA38XC08_9EURO|nr:hypothetical protein H2200_005138 [Cladophialophora chaetospira]
MMIDINDPACSCGSLCAQPTSPPAQLKPGSSAAAIDAVAQNTTLPTSFFRLISELRDKIYFLSCRPDCRYSLGGKEGCDKRHIHNSAKGRTSAWKWLVLCRQTWSEASQYMPIIQNDIRFYINDDNCGRCCERDELREIWYTRLQKLSIQFENIETWHGATSYRSDRFAHNFDSFIAFVGKLRSLKEISVEVRHDFVALLGTNTDVSGSMTRLFSVLNARIDNGSLKINISQKTCEIDASASESILQLAALAGLSNNDINLTTIKIDRPQAGPRFNPDSFLDNFNWELWRADEERWEASLASQLLYRTRLFDEDFEGISEPAEPTGMYEGQPTYYLRSGCVMTDYPKYSRLRYSLPLYIEEDFYNRSQLATQEYRPIPECFGCGVVFSGFEQMSAHVGQCAGKDDTMTPVRSPWDD